MKAYCTTKLEPTGAAATAPVAVNVARRRAKAMLQQGGGSVLESKYVSGGDIGG